jgi:hypothetical protein
MSVQDENLRTRITSAFVCAQLKKYSTNGASSHSKPLARKNAKPARVVRFHHTEFPFHSHPPLAVTEAEGNRLRGAPRSLSC